MKDLFKSDILYISEFGNMYEYYMKLDDNGIPNYYPKEDKTYTAVVIFDSHARNNRGESELSTLPDVNYLFTTFCYCLDVFNEKSKIYKGNTSVKIAYSKNLRYSTLEEKIALLNKIKTGLINV